MFQNSVPSFDVPTYSIHVDNGVHVSCPDTHHDMFNLYHHSDDNSLFSVHQSDADDSSTDALPGGTAV